jgi:Cu+-exporting ATPase
MKEKYNISGMMCAVCAGHIEKAVKLIHGVSNVEINLLKNSMFVSYDDKKTKSGDIIKAVQNAGYNAFLAQDANVADVKKNDKKQLIISAALLIILLYISMGEMLSFPLISSLSMQSNIFCQLVFTLFIVFLNKSYFTIGFKTLLKISLTMNSLVALSSGSALIYGLFAFGQILKGHMDYHANIYFESAATILVFVSIGRFLENSAKGKTGSAIAQLMRLSPQNALVEKNGVIKLVPIKDIEAGDIIIVKSGGSIPANGVIIEGNGVIDESAISGESLPVEKTIGDSVTNATILNSGYFKMTATHSAKDSFLANIIKLVEEASASKAPIARLADKISSVFVPFVIIIASVTAITWMISGKPFEFSLSMAISVLIISCPCALGLATPMAINIGIGKAAQNGILFKNAESLEMISNADTIVFDKTGTLTYGKLSVTGIRPAQNADETELLTLAASVESLSQHPIANAIVEKAKEKNIVFEKPDNFKEIFGKGIKAVINRKEILIGNLKFLNENGLYINSETFCGGNLYQSQNEKYIYVSQDNKLLGTISLSDNIKPESKLAVNALIKMKFNAIFLTGDTKEVSEFIGKQIGMTNIISESTPQEKENVIRQLQTSGKIVAMVGDGINDAPALVKADIGIAIGAGSNIAIESAGIILLKNNPLDIVTTIKLSRAVLRNIKQNLFWAFFYNAALIPLSAGVFYSAYGLKLNPMFSAAAMSLSSLFVVVNALRLKRWKS